MNDLKQKIEKVFEKYNEKDVITDNGVLVITDDITVYMSHQAYENLNNEILDGFFRNPK